MTTDPATGKTYSYLKTNNQLATVAAPFTSLAYDALDRLWHVEIPAVTNYVTDGTDTIAEYDGSNALQKRYAFDGTGWPLVQYDAAGNRSWMLPDERGSIVALANDSAAMTAINTYDEYGIPAASNAGTFQYASMLWLSRAGVYAPTFRAYGAHLGRFNQTDPSGMAAGINLYNYTGDDPVNQTDPLGLDYKALNPPCAPGPGCSFDPLTGNIFVTGSALDFGSALSGGGSGGGGFGRARSPTAGFSMNPGDGRRQSSCLRGFPCGPSPCPPAPSDMSHCAINGAIAVQPRKSEPQPFCPSFNQTEFAIDVAKGATAGLAKSVRQAEFAVLLGGGIGTAIEPGGGTLAGAAAGVGVGSGIVFRNAVGGAAFGAGISVLRQCRK